MSTRILKSLTMVAVAALPLIAIGCIEADDDLAEEVGGENDFAVSNTGITGYPTSTQLESKAMLAAGAAFGDINADGSLDIVLARGRHWAQTNHVILGDGKGGVLKDAAGKNLEFDLSPADRSYSADLVDLDLDGDLDLVIGNDSPDAKRIYMNDGKGGFPTQRTYGSPDWSMRYATVADMNGDGAPDIVVANRSSGIDADYICFNKNVNGKYGNFPLANCKQFSSVPATAIATADFNGDGHKDALVPHRNGGQSYLYFGPGFTQKVAWGPANAQIRMAAAVDLNNNGVLDVVTVSRLAKGIRIYLGTAGNTFTLTDATATFAPLSGQSAYAIPNALAVGDLNCDGNKDFVVGFEMGAYPKVFFNTGAQLSKMDFGGADGTSYGVAIGDFNKDGRPDIALARDDAPSKVHFAAGATMNCSGK